jgi:hypothetical protein
MHTRSYICSYAPLQGEKGKEGGSLNKQIPKLALLQCHVNIHPRMLVKCPVIHSAVTFAGNDS